MGREEPISPPAGGEPGPSQTEARLAAVLESVSDGFYALDHEWRYVLFNRAAERYFGVSASDLLGKVMWDVFPQGRGTPFDRACAAAMAGGETTVFETPSRLRPDRVVELRIAPMQGGGIAVTLTDITDRKRNEAARELLMREVDHRARNMLAVVQSILHLTRAGDLAGYKQIVMGRINALARAQGSLASRRWEGALVADILAEELATVGKAEAWRLEGDAVLLPPERVQPFSMVVHELATNASKYGAFSTETGEVEVTWSLTDADGLRLSWRETGGPVVQPPSRRGFGSKLIADLAKQLGGRADFDWTPDGLRFELLVRL
ncbi:PAS domain-containing protein [Phenylobacterium sp.]|uniref:sensor histidine kinase n=1 Tax=Phenylobacterium sp. TaxID=1871053 RepID=UPI00286CA42B|nr:PAS domain-containing protein [Phenylobacterium sp.]